MIGKIISELEQSGIKLNKKCTEEEFLKFTDTFEFNFPNDFKDFYLIANGFFSYIGFERHHIWDLDKICEDNTTLDKVYIKFCDTMLSVPWIGYSKEDGKIYKGYGLENEFDGNAEYLTDTFTDFLKLIKIDSESLY